MFNKRLSSIRISGPATLSLAASLLLSGCAFSGGGSTSAATASISHLSNSTSIGGMVHGGQQPVAGATVTLWAAGTAGTYGTGATALASTLSLTDGSFTFDDAVTGASPCTPGQYLYLTGSGGNAGATINNSIGLMAALPTPCVAGTGKGTTAGTNVSIDEVTTVAAVTALQQFMSINTAAAVPYLGTGTPPWMIGAPSTNTIGLANAFLQTQNLASISTGLSPASSVAVNTLNSVVYTTSIVTDYTRINTIADILASCINDSTGSACTGASGVLTYTAITAGTTTTTPVDTIQAAYNMATLPNPALYTGAKYWTRSNSTNTYLSVLYPNISAMSPFQPYASATPKDTSIAVKWSTSSPSGTVGTIFAGSLAIDGNGNIWTATAGSTTAATLNEFNQAGQLQQTIATANYPTPAYTFTLENNTATPITATTATAPTGSLTLSYARAQALAIDTNNDAWFAESTLAATGTYAGITASPIVEVTPTGTATAYLGTAYPNGLAIDASNNLFFDAYASSSKYYISLLPAVPPGGPAYESVYLGVGRTTGLFAFSAVASDGYVWSFSTSTTCTGFGVERASAAGIEANVVANVTLPNCAYKGAGDSHANMFFTDYANIYYGNIASSLTSPTVTNLFTGGAALGVYNPSGLALDGLGNLWISSSSNAVEELAITGGTTPTATLLSPAGTSNYGFESGFMASAPSQAVLDSSGNVWLASASGTSGGSYLYYLVGAAAPVLTPLAAMYNGKYGVRP